MTFPITLGKGKRLFEDGTQAHSFKLTKCQTSSTGVNMTAHIKMGSVEIGSVEFATPTEAKLARHKRLAKEI